MDAMVVGENIALHRRKMGLTQVALADMLHISSKTVSKWENGQGFPEVTQFPALAEIFGVTVDYLMTGQRKGIILAGSTITDIVKDLDCYPEKGMLANISGVSRAVGGCAPNTAIDLARIDRKIPLSIYGCVGDDDNGRFMLSQLQRYNIDVSRISVESGYPTSFCDVMSLPSGERTFFSARGANSVFSPDDIDLSNLQGAILHIGYILLLDKFDAPDKEYGTAMARFLCNVKQRGIKTSFDVVSDTTADYKAKILPVLKYCDYCIINEQEASRVTDLDPYNPDGTVNIENIRRTAQILADGGVNEKVIIHCKAAGFCLNVADGSFTMVPSLKIPEEKIKGSVGAGDAFCAGCLYSIYNQQSDEEMLKLASAAAASSLFASNSTDGVLPLAELEEMMEKYDRISKI